MIAASLEATNGFHQETLLPPRLSGERATYKANGYLGKHIGMFYGASEPELFYLEDGPIWQVVVCFQQYHVGPVRLAFLDVNALSGEVIPLTETQICQIRSRAHAYIKHHPLRAAPIR